MTHIQNTAAKTKEKRQKSRIIETDLGEKLFSIAF